MSTLHGMTDLVRRKKKLRVGRGTGAGRGKTCGRGIKGQGARSGYKRRYGTEGGGLPLYRRLPTRGFSRARFLKRLDIINLLQIEAIFEDGDTVNLETLAKHGFITGKSHGLKVLAQGELTKKVKIEAKIASAAAQEKLKKAGATLTLVD